MKTIVRNKMLTVFVAVFVILSFMTIFFGFNTVKAEVTEVSINEATVEIDQKASIKSVGNMGIRFTASVSAKDYNGLKAKYGNVEYGMIIAPSDFVVSANTFKIGGWEYATGDNVTEYVEGTSQSGKLYQRAKIDPILVNGEYIFKGAFVNIATENYDRDFSVRAYVKVEGADPIYSDVASRSVFTVANGLLSTGAMNDDAIALEYIMNVEKVVYDEYTTRSVAFANVTEGKQATDKPVVGDKIAFTTTLSNGTKTITAKPVIKNYGSYMTENVDADGYFDGTYTVNKAEDFGVMATMCSSYSSYTADGLGDDNPTILVDCEQETLEVEDITLENAAEGQKWAGFFSFVNWDSNTKNIGSIKVISEAIENDDISAAALATCPTGEDVYVINSPAYVKDAVSLGAGMQDKLLNKYISFKFYNFGYDYQKHSLSINELYVRLGSSDSLINNGSTGRYIRSVYDCYGNNIGSTDVNGYNAYQGTWCTMEISLLQWFNSKTKGITLHADALNVSGTYQNVFISDVKVSNVPLSEMYSDLEVRVEDKNGETIQPGDELAFSAYAMPFGGSEKVKVNALISTTSGAMDGNIYQGIGNFTVTAEALGMTATKEVTAVQGIIPKKDVLDLDDLKVYFNANKGGAEENVTYEFVTSDVPTGAPVGAKVLKVHYKYNEASYQDSANLTEITNYNIGALEIKKDSLYVGCYITFKFYVDATAGSKICFNEGILQFNYAKPTTSTKNWDGTNATYALFADDGTLVTNANLKNYKGQWINAQIHFPQDIPGASVSIWQYQNKYNKPAADLYIADLAVQNYENFTLDVA